MIVWYRINNSFIISLTQIYEYKDTIHTPSLHTTEVKSIGNAWLAL